MIALAVLLVALGPAAPVDAPKDAPVDASRILVVPKDGADPEPVYAGLRAAGLLPVELDERAGVDREPAPVLPTAARDNARAHLIEAKARFRELDLEATRAAVDAVVDEVLRLDRPEDAKDTLIDALLLRANVALQAGVDDDAKAALALVSRLDPERSELHPGLYPPSLCEAYLVARASEQAAPPASLLVRPRVAGFAHADVVVDGKPASAGLEVGGVRAGPHVVVVSAPGTRTFARLIDLTPAEPAVLEPFLAPVDAAVRRAALVLDARRAVDDEARGNALAALADLCAARAVLFLGAAPSSTTAPPLSSATEQEQAQLWSAHGLETLPVSSTADGVALGRATLAALQAPARRDAGLPPVDDGSVSPVTIVAVSAVGVAVLAGFGYVAFYLFAPGNPPAKLPPRPVETLCCIP